MVPLELQPQADRRQTRAGFHKSYATKNKYGSSPSRTSSKSISVSKQAENTGKRPQSAGKATTSTNAKSPLKREAVPFETKAAKEHPAVSPIAVTTPKYQTNGKNSPDQRRVTATSPLRNRRSTKQPKIEEKDELHVGSNGLDGSFSPEASPGVVQKVQRLKLRVRPLIISVQNPAHVLPSRRHSSFREWLDSDDPGGGESGIVFSQKEAAEEALMRQRILDASLPGGTLSEEKCSLFVPEGQEEPPQQYAHHDHLIAHAVNFKRLLDQEHRRHILTAKRIAHAALAEWKKRQPKTEDEVFEEQRNASIVTYKQVRRDLTQKWEMVTAAVKRKRLERWQEEQQALGKQALNRVLEQSTQMLHNRTTRDDSDARSDDDNSDVLSDHSGESATERSSDEDDRDEDEDNLSSSSGESNDGPLGDEDEGLTTEQLRQKYAIGQKRDRSLEHEGDIKDLDPATQDLQVDVAVACPRDEKPEPPDGNFVPEVGEEHFSSPRAGNESRRKSKLLDEGVADSEADMHTDEDQSDETDHSTDMEDDMGDSDEDMDSNELEESDGSVDQQGLMSLYTTNDLTVGDDVGDNERANSEYSDMPEDEVEEVSLIPGGDDPESVDRSFRDVQQQGSDGSLPIAVTNHHIEAPELSPTRLQAHPDSLQTRNETQKADPTMEDGSTQASLHTNESKVPDAESVSSLELHQDIKRQSATTSAQRTPNPRTPIPSLLRGTLREYQHDGLDWLAGLYANRTNGILADEMGLGKTIQTIALLAHLAVEHHVWGPHLIVVPTSVMLNWEMEFKKFCPGFKVMTYYGTIEERKQKRKGWQNDDLWNVYITSYQLVLQDHQVFRRRSWHYMVLDEAHNIKNFQSLRWKTLLGFNTRARLLLTGTPLQNNLTELWSLLYFLMPTEAASGMGGFADLKEFSDWFKKPVDQILEHGRDTMDDEARMIVTKLHKILRPYLLRRLKADVEKQMPAKYEHIVNCRLSKRQRYLYDGFMSLSQTRETLASGNYLSIINCLMQLRKVCNHPDLFETRPITTSFAMPPSIAATYTLKEQVVRKKLLGDDQSRRVALDFLQLVPISDDSVSALGKSGSARFNGSHVLRGLHERARKYVHDLKGPDFSTIESSLSSLKNVSRVTQAQQIERTLYHSSQRYSRNTVWGRSLIDFLTLDLRGRSAIKRPRKPVDVLNWSSSQSNIVLNLTPTLEQRSNQLESTIQKFGCITPSVVTVDLMHQVLGQTKLDLAPRYTRKLTRDPFHEARMRLSIAFPDKRLLQYDCGKLQRLDKLLRDLQAGGHRALIFTQMTKVLDILEQFLNIHGHRYLRLDGATKVEQRQVLTDRFNNDPRILAFILSTRSGGLGINLTGADTVIFYDLDWNPAMDKQCQDRCHRIGQTRDVHIYRFVSEYTIESNILRKSNQKRMLDDVVIQEGEFTTDYFNKLSVRDMLGDEALEQDETANAAMDKILGSESDGAGKVFAQVEDQEDAAAAKVAEKEVDQADDGDFNESLSKASATPKESGPPTPGDNELSATLNTHGSVDASTTLEAVESGLARPGEHLDVNMDEAEDEPGHIDEYMLRFMEWDLRDIPVAPPVDKNKKRSKKGRDHDRRRR